jgi:adenosylhomocysteine nucleosidase
MPAMENAQLIVLISADAEWRAVRKLFPQVVCNRSPFGEFFQAALGAENYLFFQGGWGKIAAAASTQYALDRWRPKALINLGTCGGFLGETKRGEIILAEKTIVYDIIEQMGDFAEHIAHYTTELDLSWLGEPYPLDVRRAPLISGDRDLLAEEISSLKERYHAIAGDWESGAIAWVAKRNHTPLLILRGVTDLVSEAGGEAYGNPTIFEEASAPIMKRLVASLPGWNIQL